MLFIRDRFYQVMANWWKQTKLCAFLMVLGEQFTHKPLSFSLRKTLKLWFSMVKNSIKMCNVYCYTLIFHPWFELSIKSLLNDFLSNSVEIIPGAYTKTRKKENIGCRNTFKRKLIFFSLVYIYADVVNGIFGITSRGGDGKKGQDGGNGAAGRDSGHRVGMLFMFLNFLYKAFSLTWSAKLQIHWLFSNSP